MEVFPFFIFSFGLPFFIDCEEETATLSRFGWADPVAASWCVTPFFFTPPPHGQFPLFLLQSGSCFSARSISSSFGKEALLPALPFCKFCVALPPNLSLRAFSSGGHRWEDPLQRSKSFQIFGPPLTHPEIDLYFFSRIGPRDCLLDLAYAHSKRFFFFFFLKVVRPPLQLRLPEFCHE